MKSSPLFAIALLGLMVGGCAKAPQTGKGFYLPVGNARHGQEVFVKQNCTRCHSVQGVALPAPAHVDMTLALGGDVSRVRSYGDLVTAIIYPSHEVSDLMPSGLREKMTVSAMPNVTDTMTVAELIDVVTFLQPRYRQVVNTTYGYGYPVPP